MPEAPVKRSALIVGAGVSGMAAAWWLDRLGWRVTVVERAANLRADGYMIGLSGPGHAALRHMGLLPALARRNRRINENVYYGRDGKVLLRLRYHEFLKGLDWLTVARTDLVEVLHEAVRSRADIRFGTTVADLATDAGGVDARLTDASVHRVDLLIAADGIHSATRARVFGPESDFATRLGYRCAAFQAEDTLGLGHDFLSYAEPGRLAEFYTLDEGRLATLYVWSATDAPPLADKRAALRAAFDGAHPNAVKWIDELPADQPLFLDDMTLIEMPSWSKGRVLLLGDAAHSLTLLSGQGAGMGLTSACLLAIELGHADIDTALARHEARLRPAIQRLQQRSRKMAAWFIPATPRAFAIRNRIMRWAPRWLLGWYFLRAVRSELVAAADGQDWFAGADGLGRGKAG
jgi:2-polyprenyl-6-methoxyphenol hydroxylase-like FAD-dependent oxidoreductase